MNKQPTKGLSFPKSAGSELREMLLQQMEEPAGQPPTGPPDRTDAENSPATQLDEEMKKPSNEGRHVPSNDASFEGSPDASNGQIPTRGNGDTGEGWIEAVRERAKARSGKEPLTRLNVDVPERVHKRLRLHCLLHETTIRDEVCAILEAYLDAQGRKE